MNDLNGTRWLIGSALALWSAFGLAWLSGRFFVGAPWLLHIAAFGLGLTTIVGWCWWTQRRVCREHRMVQRYFEALCQGIGRSTDRASLPPTPTAHPWRRVAEQVETALRELRQQVDQNEQRRATLELRCRRAVAETEQIRQIFSGLADPVLAVDQYDELVLANPSAEQLFGIPSQRPEPRALDHLVRCEKLVQLLSATRQHKTSGHRTDEIEMTDDVGRSHWYRATAVKLSGGDDPIGGEGAVVTLRDIGDQKSLQKRNAEFVSSVSHEMKTPLAGIKAYVELLADGDAEDEQTREEFLSVINSQTDRLQRLVDNLLNLARIEAGVVSVSKRHRSLNELLEESLHVVQPSAEAKQIELRAELSPLYLGVQADRDMMLQAAINLLSNAIKYTRPGGSVTLRSRLVDNQARFEVQDTGVGLSEEDCTRVFEKFYRVRKDKDMAAGTGLGLPLAKHIVEDVHGGTLSVESVPEQGSTFIVALPCTGQMLNEG
ncbi:MAG: PAS domain-containing protein [Planctomycetaceae bacterium]|nr:PAS domain-containing protein [Planctomycetaceae bacterium]